MLPKSRARRNIVCYKYEASLFCKQRVQHVRHSNRRIRFEFPQILKKRRFVRSWSFWDRNQTFWSQSSEYPIIFQEEIRSIDRRDLNVDVRYRNQNVRYPLHSQASIRSSELSIIVSSESAVWNILRGKWRNYAEIPPSSDVQSRETWMCRPTWENGICSPPPPQRPGKCCHLRNDYFK